MAITIVKLAAFGALLALSSAYNTNRRNDEIENDEKHSLSGFNRWFIVIEDILPENTSSPPSITTDSVTKDLDDNDEEDPDPLSVVWYLGAFGGLIVFFLVVTFSEWCCASKHLYRRQALQGPYITTFSDGAEYIPQTPPPPYHLFAPPPYEVVSSDKTQYPILIIPVHRPQQPQQPQAPVQT